MTNNICFIISLKHGNQYRTICPRCIIFAFHLLLPANPCADDSYQNLTDVDRSVNFTGNVEANCDNDDITAWDIWYRVSGNAGNALRSSTAPPPDSCGTEARLYLQDDHPHFGDGEVTQKVCVSRSAENSCNDNNDNAGNKFIQVINCGAFYLYKLVHLRGCTNSKWAYCTNGQGMYHRFLCGGLKLSLPQAIKIKCTLTIFHK